jgi:hypothetical protein
MANKAERRFFHLEVDEVSLVGSPANEVPFHVIKKQPEDPTMNAAQKDGTETVVLAHKSEAPESAIAKSLQSVESMLSSVISLAKAATTPAPAALTEEEEVEKGALSEATAILTKAGVTGDALTSALAGFKKALPAFLKKPGAKKDEEDEEEKKKTKKSAAEAESDSVANVVEHLAKAARFTPARLEKLAQAAELLKLVMEGVATGQSPDTKAPKGTSPASGIQSQVAKSDDDMTAVSKALESITTSMATSLTEVTKALTALGARVDAVESAKPASDSASAAGTDTKTTKSASIFRGVV